MLKSAPVLSEPELHTAWADGKLGRTLTIVRLDDAAYHSGPGVSSTDLKWLLKSPAHYAAKKLEAWKETPALFFGKAGHEAFFQPDVFESKYLVKSRELSDNNCAKNPWKAQWDELKAQAEVEKKSILDFYQVQDIAGMLHKVHSSPIWSQQIEPNSPIYELAFYWFDQARGILLKAKVDILVWSLGLVVDLKTTDDAEAYFHTSKKYRYHVSAAHYLRVASNATNHAVDNFGWIFLEKESPFEYKFVAARPETISEGNRLTDIALDRYAECMAKEQWPGYARMWEELSITA